MVPEELFKLQKAPPVTCMCGRTVGKKESERGGEFPNFKKEMMNFTGFDFRIKERGKREKGRKDLPLISSPLSPSSLFPHPALSSFPPSLPPSNK